MGWMARGCPVRRTHCILRCPFRSGSAATSGNPDRPFPHRHGHPDRRGGGVPVLAAQTGRISRVKVSDSGYGLALYLDGRRADHGLRAPVPLPSRHRAVAADHAVRRRVLGIRWPAGGAVGFEAGDTIGWSGNSGRSFGPHLHFEVRDQRTQWPINPLRWTLVGEGVTEDDVPPEFRAVWVLPVGDCEGKGRGGSAGARPMGSPSGWRGHSGSAWRPSTGSTESRSPTALRHRRLSRRQS